VLTKDKVTQCLSAYRLCACWPKNNNNNNPIYKAPKALASEALAAGQSWMLIKSLTEEVRLSLDLNTDSFLCV